MGWREGNSKFYRCIGPGKHRFGNKFGAERPRADALATDPELLKRFGHFDSRLELDYWREVLGWLEKAGEVSQVRHHTIIELVPGFTYETDWDYLTKAGVRRYVDTKGKEDARFKCILDLWPIFGHGPLDILKKVGARWLTKTIMAGKWKGTQGPTGAWEFRKVA